MSGRLGQLGRLGRPGRPGWPGWPGWPSLCDHAWALLALGLALGALAGRGASLAPWGWVPGHAWTEPWRWWSAAFVHLSDGHLAANVMGCAVVGVFGHLAARAVQAPAATRDWTLAWLAAWPLTHLMLLVEPRLAGYGGLSGVLHAGVAVAALGLALQGRGRPRGVGAAVLAGLIVKVALEQPWRAPVQALAHWDVPVAVAAHAAGAAAGLACAALVRAARERATMRRPNGATRPTDPP